MSSNHKDPSTMTTHKDTLLELADRCESATGPDRELDAAISEAIGNCLHTPVVQEVSWSDGTKDLVPVCTKCGAKNAYQEWHRFTASLDAAMTLVPEGCGVDLRVFVSGGGRADLYPHGFTREVVESRNCHTPSLALCAASLRARAAQ